MEEFFLTIGIISAVLVLLCVLVLLFAVIIKLTLILAVCGAVLYVYQALRTDNPKDHK